MLRLPGSPNDVALIPEDEEVDDERWRQIDEHGIPNTWEVFELSPYYAHPVFGEIRKAYIAALGCRIPAIHDDCRHSKLAKCPLVGNRALCLQQLKNNEREQRLLHQLGTMKRLPEELVMRILHFKASSAFEELDVDGAPSLAAAASELLGNSYNAQSLHAFMTQALLEAVPIRLDVSFKRQSDRTVVSQLPALGDQEYPHLRTLIIEVPISIGPGEHKGYAGPLYRATAGMHPLSKQLSSLHSFTLRLRVTPLFTGRKLIGEMSETCRVGWQDRDTYRNRIESLLEAVQSSGLGKTQLLHVILANELASGESIVHLDNRPAAQTLEEASESMKWRDSIRDGEVRTG